MTFAAAVLLSASLTAPDFNSVMKKEAFELSQPKGNKSWIGQIEWVFDPNGKIVTCSAKTLHGSEKSAKLFCKVVRSTGIIAPQLSNGRAAYFAQQMKFVFNAYGDNLPFEDKQFPVVPDHVVKTPLVDRGVAEIVTVAVELSTNSEVTDCVAMLKFLKPEFVTAACDDFKGKTFDRFASSVPIDQPLVRSVRVRLIAP